MGFDRTTRKRYHGTPAAGELRNWAGANHAAPALSRLSRRGKSGHQANALYSPQFA
jgi:hypothetical protein